MLIYIIFAVLVGHITCQSRIIGGNYANPGDFPHHVSLILNGHYHCGGSIISETFIVTAAHCTFGKHPSEIKVIVGTTNLFAGDGLSFNSAQFIEHPYYRSQQYDYDISLIRLSNALPLGTRMVNKIEMISAGTILTPNTMALVGGFGSTNANLQSSNYLKYAYVPLWGRDYCNARYDARITERMICAGNPSGQESSCQGDSGGSLTLNNKLIGIVSWGPGCGKEGPAKYASVAAFRSWIKQNTGV